MRKMNNLAQMGMVGTAVGILITLIIAVLITYSILGSFNPVAIDAKLPGSCATPAQNATNSTMTQIATFFTIAPIIVIVIVAVVVIGYVQRIGG